MRRIFKLTPALNREGARQTYQHGLQAMWEARWTLVGGEGKVAWLHRHGFPPPIACSPLTSASTRHGLRYVMQCGPSMPLFRAVQRIRRDL